MENVLRTHVVTLLMVSLLSLSALTLTSPEAEASAARANHSVNIQSFAFSPSSLTIDVGDTVEWTNNDGTSHTATSTSGPASFDSGTIGSGSSFSFTFTTAGTYDYQCNIHTSMTASITVEEENDPPVTGISGLSATLLPNAQIELAWGLSDAGAVVANDFIRLYHCDGAGCDALSGTAISLAITSSTTTLNGQDGGVIGVLVRVENGLTDTNGDTLFGTPIGSLEVTADGSVSPAPSNIVLNSAGSGTSTAFSWTADDTADVASWKLCWSTSQFVASEFDSLSCADTSDDTGSLTVTNDTICGGTCSGEFHFAVAGVDPVGNVASEGTQLSIDWGEGQQNPNGSDEGVTVEVLVRLVDGSSHEMNVTLGDNETGWNATLAVLDANSISYNATDGQFGIFVGDIGGALSEAQWGDFDNWWWGLFVWNGTTSAWDSSWIGISDIELENGSKLAWAPTFAGVWTEQAFPEQLAEMQALQIQVDICDAADNIILLGGDGISFSPDYLQIDAGESVCWTWTDIALDHNFRQVSVEGETQGMEGGFGVETPDSDVWYTFVFNDNGTYPYICELHSLIGMTGTIQIGPVPEPEPEPEPEPIHDEPEEKTPGFGIGLGVIALLGAAMLAGRRND